MLDRLKPAGTHSAKHVDSDPLIMCLCFGLNAVYLLQTFPLQSIIPLDMKRYTYSAEVRGSLAIRTQTQQTIL